MLPDAERPDAAPPLADRDQTIPLDDAEPFDAMDAIDAIDMAYAIDDMGGMDPIDPPDLDPPDMAPPLTPQDCAPLDLCGRDCADLDRDPQNCGVCGRTCVIPHADAACLDGMCQIAACDPGWFDADGDPDTGCELESQCEPDAPCESDCGTPGTQLCQGGLATCAPPPEVCNAADDDCDGACDNGPLAGCRRPVHRSNGNGHLFTDDLAQATRAPFRLEAEAFFHLYQSDVAGTRAAFLCQKPNGRYFLTSDTACEIGRAPTRTIGYWATDPRCGAVPLYRLYSGEAGNHFYTVSANEADNAANNLGYQREGIAGYVWRGP